MKHKLLISALLAALCLLCAGCGKAAPTAAPAENVPLSDGDSLRGESQALSAAAAAIPLEDTVTAPGIDTLQCDTCTIDYSNMGDGYVMVLYSAKTDKRLKLQLKGPATTYSYNLPVQEWQAFPLSDGNGRYQISVFRNVADNRYAAELELFLDVVLSDETAPFLRSNQYVNFDNAPKACAKAAELTASVTDPLEIVSVIYDYVTGSLKYNYDLASKVESGYLPDLDHVMELGKGICFDYAALMTGMLRSRGVPCKLVVGYMDDVYHAWISVYSSEENSWIDAMYFDGTSWHRMDPTMDSGKQLSFFAARDSASYVAKYFY